MTIIDPTKIVDKVTDLIDDSFESREEAEQMRTRRLEIDTTSPFKLPHLIRPISFIWTLSLETILIIASIILSFLEAEINSNVSNVVMASLASNTTILTAQVGFYFNARKAEKINAKKSFAAIEIEREKAKVAISKEKMLLIEEKKQNRRDAKKERRANRKV